MSANFSIAETESFQRDKQKKEYKKIVEKLDTRIYPELKKNPFYGKHIRKLKGEFEGIYRYRIGDYRVFYTIDKEKIIVFMTNIIHRKDSYKW